jgi:hypothetical protein
MRKITFAVLLGLPLLSNIAAATETASSGRYQAIVVQSSDGGNGQNVLILDTNEGHLWRYWLQPNSGSAAGSEGIKYILQLRPGTKPGDLIGGQSVK